MTGRTLHRCNSAAAYILAIGNEARGISDDLQPWITQTVTIPFHNKTVNSLNAAVAAGIAMYELSRFAR